MSKDTNHKDNFKNKPREGGTKQKNKKPKKQQQKKKLPPQNQGFKKLSQIHSS